MRPIYELFAENLNYYMNDRNISQTQIALTMDVSMSIVSEWMNGKKAPRFGNLEKLCLCLGVTYTQLFADRSIDPVLTPKEEQLITAYKQISDTGKKKLLEYAQDMEKLYEEKII